MSYLISAIMAKTLFISGTFIHYLCQVLEQCAAISLFAQMELTL